MILTGILMSILYFLVWGSMPRKSRFHMPGVAGIVRFPEKTATIEHNLESLYVEQQGDPDLDLSENEALDHADQHRTVNDLIFPIPTPTWWEYRDEVEIEDIFIQGDFIEDVEILKITVRQGNRQPPLTFNTVPLIWRDMVHITDANLDDDHFSVVRDISDRIVVGGVAVVLTIRFNREQEPFSGIRIHSVGAQFDPTPFD